MATERAHTIEVVVNLKRALAEASDASESDDSIAYTSNRGRKLKRRAKWVHEGKLDDGKGHNAFKQEVEYFGKRKMIIYRKPDRRKRTALDSDDDYSQSSDSDASGSDVPEENPYEGVKIEDILAPLESAADLPSHPALSYVYTSPTLGELLQQSLDKISEEYRHTWKIKNLLTRFLGDDPYVNLEKMEWPEEDFDEVARQRAEELGIHAPRVNGDTAPDVPMEDVNGHAAAPSPDKTASNGIAEPPAPGEPAPDAARTDEDEPVEGTGTPPPVRRMTTRSAVVAAGGSPAPASPPVEVDAFFFPPAYSVDRDCGLPAAEAEETRRLLSAAVQRQDEFLRGLNCVRQDLLRASNLRKKVWGWCRAMEGVRAYHEHMTEVSGNAGRGAVDIEKGEGVALSDGEDWYDKDEWGLDGPLEKGREEEDEDIMPQSKKTRGRK